MNKILVLTAALLTGSLTLQAAPRDWVGKKFPAVKAEYLAKAPNVKGSVTVVEFWATWCGPCRAAIPHLNTLAAAYKSRGLVIIGVTDEDRTTVNHFRKSVPMDYNVAVDESQDLANKLGVNSIPQAFLLDRNGKVLWEGHSMELTGKIIEKALK